MALHGNSESSDPLRPDPIRRLEEAGEYRLARTSRLASGTLACPLCDAPVMLGLSPATPTDPMSCPYCRYAGAVRDFLSLEAPARATHVDVRVVPRSRL